VAYYFSNADKETTLDELALVISTRWRVEEYSEGAKKHLGMAAHESHRGSWLRKHKRVKAKTLL